MGLRVDYFGVAEGAAVDLRGALTLVGFNSEYLPVEKFPAELAPAIILIVVDDETPESTILPGREVRVALQVQGPKGDVLFANRSSTHFIGERRIEELPRRLQLIATVKLLAADPGIYSAHSVIEVSDTDVSVEADMTFGIYDPKILLGT